MTRPNKIRKICLEPNTLFFKPRGLPLKQLEVIKLTLDELEAVRLCYHENFYQDEAAREMDISRQTLGRILNSANRKIADFLVNGRALKIEGGNVKIASEPARKNILIHKEKNIRRRGCEYKKNSAGDQ